MTGTGYKHTHNEQSNMNNKQSEQIWTMKSLWAGYLVLAPGLLLLLQLRLLGLVPGPVTLRCLSALPLRPPRFVQLQARR